MSLPLNNCTEWLEPDGLGGFASGTTSGERARRYHALLLAATQPPTGRMVLVNGFDAWIETPAGRFPISTQRYSPNVLYPDNAPALKKFQIDPWPQWTFSLPDGTTLVQELFVPHGLAACCLRWTFNGQTHAALTMRPLMSGRDYHSTHHENSAFRFEPITRNDWLVWQPYDGVPEICALTNGQYTHTPVWYRKFLYVQEQERGLDYTEDLASPGTWQFDLSQPAVLIWTAQGNELSITCAAKSATAEGAWTELAHSEQQRRSHFPTPLHRSADAFLVRRGTGRTVIAGYPWFTDWGRDTFVSLRGLCLALGKLDVALEILLAWSATVSEGMLPNRFPDSGDVEFNSVDASLWFIIAVHELLHSAAQHGQPIGAEDRATLEQAVLAIVKGYSRGTRYGIRQDTDSLLAAGQPGMQLTWMDAKIGDHVVTPRSGKPVEVQALWLNALWIAGRIDRRWTAVFENAQAQFERRFWNSAAGCLYDVIDVDHRPGTADASIRPNQIFAVGGLPLSILHGDRARRIVDCVETHLLTPPGLRSLAPGSPGYAPQCIGPPEQRDAAYHQGTVWPWLIGPFVEAWVRVRGGTPGAKKQALEKFLPPLVAHLHSYGLNHISEITDAEPPFTARGCPFQAWSLGEFLRLQYCVLQD
ncbi:MAG TPA: amylo-alpha-1,6-glucosidase [Pirellulales bacterium]|jgi:predicted glycogen debranching enzyme|nr:amylo-alpha-1,6-glucosidase [Pirellulales bacterium]